MKPTRALSVRAFISVLDEIYCGFRGFFARFLLSNRLLRPPPSIISQAKL